MTQPDSTINTSAVEALKPCPFCGRSNAKVFGPYGWYRQYGISHSCASFYSGTEMMKDFASAKDAVSAWNTRATPTPASEAEDFDRPHIKRLHRLQHDGTPPAAKPKWGASIIGWAADEIIALRARALSPTKEPRDD